MDLEQRLRLSIHDFKVFCDDLGTNAWGCKTVASLFTGTSKDRSTALIARLVPKRRRPGAELEVEHGKTDTSYTG